MNRSLLSTCQLSMAKSLLKQAIHHQQEFEKSLELIERAAPVLWRGQIQSGNMVTIGTNPSAREFLKSDQTLLENEKASLYVRDQDLTVANYQKDEEQLEQTIENYCTYFQRDTAYRRWFGKENGGKLEAFMNGLGGSFYASDQFTPVVHMDIFPYATYKQMGQIPYKEKWLQSNELNELLRDTLRLLNPSLLVILGKEHCQRLSENDHLFSLKEIMFSTEYPDARYQLGFYSDKKIPLIGLHYKPSEQFVALGSKRDRNGVNHGTYGSRAVLYKLGQEVNEQLKSQEKR
ncbi:hypothetical protein [Pseudalkalibacillus hwajinpoensis]|uniref:hypothetical protein n=1 Tax=Guptibacillus hwajinpoensis TaxID=208199 RepID=UPI001CD46408|nr:hypothetical protein [Pseudalkalibacillus hwajinpoensis]MCA0991865.1 hypothetical protein [Pseudalkalibacillus hwajinpoensis]